jgi:steroid delta-isomerase-like uncharacterized protein
MSLESTRNIIDRYWNSDHKDVSMMAEDVVFTVMATGEETRTPQGILGLLDYFYRIAFEATAEMTNSILSDGRAVWEGYFVGKHTGEFAGIPATGKEVRVPLLISYDLENDQIRRARIYFEMPVLMQQLGVTQAPKEAAA